MWNFTAILFVACVVGAAAPSPARAQAFPSQPIKLIVPFAPGGGVDIVGRTLAEHVVRVLGFVNCAPGYNTPSLVMRGFSDLMIQVFGPGIGRHTRSSIGIAELYADMPVEVEALFEIRA